MNNQAPLSQEAPQPSFTFENILSSSWRCFYDHEEITERVAPHFETCMPSLTFGQWICDLGYREPQQGLALYIDGAPVDLSDSFSSLYAQKGEQSLSLIEIVSFDDPRGKEVFWHTSAHLLAQAVLRLYPQAKPTIGPPLAQGFYYDFADLELSSGDLKKIEKEMQILAKEGLKPRKELLSKEEALSAFANNPYKLELIEEIAEKGEQLRAYRQDDFFDLCRGPHLLSLSKIKACKLLKTSGAYWRGDSTKAVLTRIYGISFPSKELLKEHLAFLEEAAARDHKVLGPKLDLFSFHPSSPGCVFLHPKGLILFDTLLAFWRELHREEGYEEIKTPQLLSKSLWETSGHWQNYQENMFVTQSEQREYALKPMSCPGGMLFYRAKHFSYKDFPLKFSEVGLVHRNELSGALSGLFRVRAFHQDDAHLFLLPDQIATEVCAVLKLMEKIYQTFSLTWHLELSTRPDKQTIGSDAQWEMATHGLKEALKLYGQDYRINEGDGAFYGPKIDVHIRDAIGRSWQCATIQLDMALPERFDLEYTNAQGERARPVMLHRAIFGSFERFMGILIEHYKGRLPLWISPEQLRILPIAKAHHARAQELVKLIKRAGIRCTCDLRDESIGKKVRSGQLDQVNYMAILGDEELQHGSLSLRSRENRDHVTLQLDAVIEMMEKEVQEKIEEPLLKSIQNA